MPFVQYTRNFEDVMLNRALNAVARGCYVDVGAYQPVVESNTYALYQRGWRGIAIDPQAAYAEKWRTFRPEDVFLAAAVGERSGETDCFFVPQCEQMASTNRESAKRVAAHGVKVVQARVAVMTLTQILDSHLKERELHLLSIDVEGAEREVLRGMDFSRYRPWILLVEATEPGSRRLTHDGWEDLALAAGYDMVYFDAVNRYYVAREHAELKQHFELPPNVWDAFVPYREVTLEQELAAERRRNRELLQQLESLQRKAGKSAN